MDLSRRRLCRICWRWALSCPLVLRVVSGERIDFWRLWLEFLPFYRPYLAFFLQFPLAKNGVSFESAPRPDLADPFLHLLQPPITVKNLSRLSSTLVQSVHFTKFSAAWPWWLASPLCPLWNCEMAVIHGFGMRGYHSSRLAILFLVSDVILFGIWLPFLLNFPHQI